MRTRHNALKLLSTGIAGISTCSDREKWALIILYTNKLEPLENILGRKTNKETVGTKIRNTLIAND